jgi:transposase InsO family protein
MLAAGPDASSCPDNGSPYRSTIHAIACRELGLRHLRTRPFRPRTNGKAERFIQTLLREWAYARLYGSSDERDRALPSFITHYNYRRRHGSLGHQAPATRLNNLLGNYT